MNIADEVDERNQLLLACRNVKHVVINAGWFINQCTFENLAKLPKIESLTIQHCGWVDSRRFDWFFENASLKNLKYLNLSYNKKHVTDKTLSLIAEK
jgi:hypothetical protein